MKRKIANLTNAIMLGIAFTLTMGSAGTTFAAQPNIVAERAELRAYGQHADAATTVNWQGECVQPYRSTNTLAHTN